MARYSMFGLKCR